MCLAIPGKILELSVGDQPLALVDVAGVRRQVNTQLIQAEKPQPGDWVLIHVGFALSRVDEKEAHEIFEYLEQIREAEVEETGNRTNSALRSEN